MLAWRAARIVVSLLVWSLVHGDLAHWTNIRTLSERRMQGLLEAREAASEIEQDIGRIAIPRVPDTGGHAKVQDYIVGVFKQLGWTLELDRFQAQTPLGRKTFTNIIASRNLKAERYLVFGAHYDSKHFPEPNTFVGAIDSAAPCAIMLDVARALEKAFSELSFVSAPYNLRFVFFDGEEAFGEWSTSDSLYGSRHLASVYRDLNQLSSLDLMVVLDLLGSKCASLYSLIQSTDILFDRLVRIEQRLKSKGLLRSFEEHKCLLFRRVEDAKNQWRFGRSQSIVDDDHAPFQLLGVPAMHVIAFPFPRQWHMPQDIVKNLDSAAVEDLSNTFVLFIAEYLGL